MASKMTFGLVSEDKKKPIAFKAWSNTGGIAIYEIVNGFEDYVVWRWEYMGSKNDRMHKSKVHYNSTNGRAYFLVNGRREFLDEYMRTTY